MRLKSPDLMRETRLWSWSMLLSTFPMKQNLGRFIFGAFFAPVVILLHEYGHYVVAMAVGVTPHMHYGETTANYSHSPLPRSSLLITAGGPAVTALMTLAGFVWLWHLRRGRSGEVATCADWLATFLALCAIRWVRCFTASPAHPQPGDEAILSAGFGFPPWLLPYLIGLASLALLVVTIRLHPRGSRLVPFGSALVGIYFGCFLWFEVVGPRILP